MSGRLGAVTAVIVLLFMTVEFVLAIPNYSDGVPIGAALFVLLLNVLVYIMIALYLLSKVNEYARRRLYPRSGAVTAVRMGATIGIVTTAFALTVGLFTEAGLLAPPVLFAQMFAGSAWYLSIPALIGLWVAAISALVVRRQERRELENDELYDEYEDFYAEEEETAVKA